MKKRGERHGRGGEGMLLAAALCLVLALSLFVYLDGRPQARTAVPVHAVDYAALRRIEMVDINAADAAELARLPGVGEALAGRIIAFREKNGAFSSIEEMLNVPGIGEGKLGGIRDLIYIDKPADDDIN